MLQRLTFALLFFALTINQSFAQLTSARPQLRFRENDQTLPLGAWRIILEGDVWRIQANTATNGLFGTAREYIALESNTGKITFGNSAGACTGCAYEFNSSTAGIRFPQLTTTNRDLITGAGAEGVVVYNSTTKAINFHNGTSWGAVGGGVAFNVRFVDPYPATTGRAFANVHESAGSGVKHFSGWGVCPGTGADCATTTADTTWELVAWDIPPVLPTGTATLRCWAIANDTSGVAKVDWQWNTCADAADCSGVTLNAEGDSTVTWAAGDNDKLKKLDIVMDASTIVAGQPVVGKLVFKATGWTEPAVSTWNCSIVWTVP